MKRKFAFLVLKLSPQSTRSNTKEVQEHGRDKNIFKTFCPIPIEVEAIGKKVLDSAYTVHSALGPGLLESVYEACIAYEIQKQRLRAETQVVVPVKHQSVFVETVCGWIIGWKGV